MVVKHFYKLLNSIIKEWDTRETRAPAVETEEGKR